MNMNTLTPKEQALLGLAAAVAAGCQPCTRSFLAKARATGACERGIRLAIETGQSTLVSAGETMGNWARQEQGPAPELDDAFRSEKSKLVALISATAAYAVNSTATLEAKNTACQAQSWTDEQIAEAFVIAGTVKRVATEKSQAAVARLGGTVPQAAVPCCAESASSGPVATRPMATSGKESAGTHGAGCACEKTVDTQ